MTAVFTPGYAAVEQFTSATQGPWTDIYGLAATLHHAIAGQAPPNSIDRMLDDAYVALAGTRRDYPPGLLAGIDAGLAVRSADRPQSIAAWRPLLLQSGPFDAATHATAVIAVPRPSPPFACRCRSGPRSGGGLRWRQVAQWQWSRWLAPTSACRRRRCRRRRLLPRRRR